MEGQRYASILLVYWLCFAPFAGCSCLFAKHRRLERSIARVTRLLSVGWSLIRGAVIVNDEQPLQIGAGEAEECPVVVILPGAFEMGLKMRGGAAGVGDLEIQ